jgi:hypothetical protein
MVVVQKKIVILALLATGLLNGCSFFIGAPPKYMAMDKAQRSALYKTMTNDTMKFMGSSAMILAVFALASDRISDEELKEEWVPKGIKAYLKKDLGAYSNGVENEDEEYVVANNTFNVMANHEGLGIPMVKSARFCAAAEGAFSRIKDFTFRLPTVERFANDKGTWAPGANSQTRANLYNAIDQANKSAFWGEFHCLQKDGKQWWVIITPDIFGGELNRNLPGYRIKVKTNVHTTPRPDDLLTLMDVRGNFTYPNSKDKRSFLRKEHQGRKILIESYVSSSKDAYGCFEYHERITQRDWLVTHRNFSRCEPK